MDRETILKIVGELYINNYLLGQRIEALTQEIRKLQEEKKSHGQSGT
jgi:hypothetical protein